MRIRFLIFFKVPWSKVLFYQTNFESCLKDRPLLWRLQKKYFQKSEKGKFRNRIYSRKSFVFFEKAFLFFDFCKFSTIKTKSAVFFEKFFLTFFKNILITTVKSTIKSVITEFQHSKIPHLMKIILIKHLLWLLSFLERIKLTANSRLSIFMIIPYATIEIFLIWFFFPRK